MRLRREASALFILLALVACGGQMPAPNADLVADTTVGKNRCQVGKENDRPFVIEWDATDIASFESKAKRDVVFVKIDGCSLKVLDCRDDGIPGKYGLYDAPQWTTGAVEGFEIKNEGDLYAKLPFGATTLSGSLKGGNELQLKYYVSGSRPALRSMIYRNDIAANPLCASATHFIAGYDMGAFDLSTKGNLGASANVEAPAGSGGGNYSHSQSHLRAAGSLDDCKKETAQELARCRVPIRLSLRAIADGANPGGAPVAGNAGGGGVPASFMTDDQQALVASSTRKMQLKDGPGCLADLDRLDASGLKAERFNMDMVRATCEMLVGRCDDGRRRYRAWLERSSPQLTPEQLDSGTALASQQSCQGKQRSPIEKIESAKNEAAEGLYRKDVSRCVAAAKVLLEECPKVAPAEKSDCLSGADHASECIMKLPGGDCEVGRRARQLYAERHPGLTSAEARSNVLAQYKCAASSAPAASTTPATPAPKPPPPQGKKKPKKKP
ncbi:MAG: hypothetical protein U0270_00350 [Labilithrix sp.]